MRKIGYARVSTGDQSLNLQIDALKSAHCDLIFKDVISGASRKRPGLDQALAALDKNDQLVVFRLCRLGRSFRHLLTISDQIKERGAHFLSLSDGVDSSSPVGEVVFRLLSVFSDFERGVIIDRTNAGIAAARRRGIRLGRPSKMNTTQIVAANRMLKDGVPVISVANFYGVGRSTLYLALKKAKRDGLTPT